jgi:hypothetical protein
MNQTNEIDEIDQIDRTNRELPLGLRLEYSDNAMRSEGV